MRNKKLKRLLSILFAVCMIWQLGACSNVISKLPPLPTPSDEKPEPTMDVFAQPEAEKPTESLPETAPSPSAEPTPAPTPEPIPVPTPEPTPVPTPEPPKEDPNTPHLFLENATYPESMPRYGVVDLYGDIYTDKGVIAMVTGRIYSNDSGEDVQICNFYPYTNTFSLAGTVNAMLIFGVLEPGTYTYVVSAIAENDSFSSGNVVLIEHGFTIYYD